MPGTRPWWGNFPLEVKIHLYDMGFKYSKLKYFCLIAFIAMHEYIPVTHYVYSLECRGWTNASSQYMDSCGDFIDMSHRVKWWRILLLLLLLCINRCQAWVHNCMGWRMLFSDTIFYTNFWQLLSHVLSELIALDVRLSEVIRSR